MKIIVPVKRVLDYNVKPRVKADGTGVDLANVKMSMNPFDEIAIEEAVRLKEKGAATEVVVVTIGVPKAETDVLLTARAMGADRAILIASEDEVEPLGVAKLLKAVCDEEMDFAQLRSGGDDCKGGVLHGRIVVLDPDQRLHFATPRALSLATSASTSATFSPAWRLAGSTTLSVLSRGETSTP